MVRAWALVAVLGRWAAVAVAQGGEATQAGNPGRTRENPRTFTGPLPVIQGEVDGRATDPVVERVLSVWPEGKVDTLKHPDEWNYEHGVLLDGMVAEWRATADGRL